MKKKTFLSGAAILGVAGLLVQMMGAVFRIPLANIISEVGMGYFQTAYPVYIFLLVFSTNGAPAAISKMISERVASGRDDEARRVFRLSFGIMFAFGVAAFAGVALLAKPLAIFVGSPDSYYSLLAIAPALFLVPIMAVFRGYFQGMQEMRPTAVSQLVEQGIRVAVGLGLAAAMVPLGLDRASAGACVGTSVGPVAGILILVIIYARDRRSAAAREGGSPALAERETNGRLLKTLAALTIPTTIGISILPIMNVADMLICRTRLMAAGFDATEAEGLYGLMSGFAAPIINIPMALALSVALSMVPAVASAAASGDREFMETNVRMGLRTAVIIGVPCGFGLMILAEPIMRLIYPARAESAAGAALCLAILGAGVLFLCVAQAMAGILQGLGRAGLPVVALAIGFAVKSVLTYALTAIPELNVDGSAAGSTAGYIVIGIINLVFVRRLTGIRFNFVLSVVKPVCAGAAMCVVVLVVRGLCAPILGSGLSTVAAIGAGALVYGVTILKLKAILPSEVAMLPRGEKLVRLLEKLRLA